ncbi:MAG: hypothetical protein ACPG6V_02850 [Flavobacteriales bacterium]
MKIYKHKTKEKYCFINNKHYNIDSYIIEKNNLVFENKFLNSDKELEQFEKKILKKGFSSYEIPTSINKQVEVLMEQFKLGTFYYFLEENESNILESNIIGLHVAKSNNSGEFYLHRISTESKNSKDKHILTDLKTFFGGRIYAEMDEIDARALEYLLPFYLKLVLTMGYVLKTQEELYSYGLKKSITQETEFTGAYFKSKFSADIIRVGYNENLKMLQYINYGLKDQELISKQKKYQIIRKKRDLKAIMDQFNNQESFEPPISQTEFGNNYRDNIQQIVYQKAKKVKPNLPEFPLEAPLQSFEIKDLTDFLLEQSKYYFYANTEAENPMDWTLSYICIANVNKGWFIYSKPFLLKDLNNALSKPIDITLKYSYEIKDFIRAQKKAFKKHNLTPISTAHIFEKYTGCTLNHLQDEKQQNRFVIEDQYDKVIDVYDHYACIRDNSFNYFYWQFFKNKTERNSWLDAFENNTDHLYQSDFEGILEHTNMYLKTKNENWNVLKRAYFSNPAIKSSFWSSHQVTAFNQFPLNIQEQVKVDEDYIFTGPSESDAKGHIFVVKGDVEVNGNLIFKKNKEDFVIIDGNVKAKNLIIVDAPEFIYIKGKMEIENITLNHSHLKCVNATTKILMHDSSDVLDLKTNISYQNEVSFYSKNIIDPSIVDKETYSFVRWDGEKILSLLEENKPFLAEVFDESETDLQEYYQRKFEERMLDWGYFYPEYAGCDFLGVYNDSEIKGKAIYPESGDWVVHDYRGKSGTYGISHEDFSINNIRLKKPSKYDVNYKDKPIDLLVNAEELMTRYQSICMLYTNWEHRTSPSFYFETHEKVTEAYEKEKLAFVNDPHLALYWLNHFGASLDTRFNEVVQVIETNNLIDKLPILREPLAFFQHTDAFYELPINNNKELFLLRRSYVVHNEHAYKNYQANNLKLWLLSITLYPKVEEQLIVRMRWLKNNLTKCENWDDFDKILEEKHKEIPLMAYVLACNPNTNDSDKTNYAHLLIKELLEYKNHFKSPHKKSFAEVLLWDIRHFVEDKSLLKKAVDFYFEGNTISNIYMDIQNVLGIETMQIKSIKEGLSALNDLYKNYDSKKLSEEEIIKYRIQLADILDKFDDKTVLEIIKNIKHREMAKHAFVWAWDGSLSTKTDIVIKLFVDLELGTYDINTRFYPKFPAFINGETLENFELIKILMHLPESSFRNDSVWEKSKKTATMFLLNHVHLPNVFDFIFKTLKQKPTLENIHLINAIHTNLLTTEYESKINSSLKLSKENMESILDAICQVFLDYGYSADAYRSIYYCANPLAKEWVVNKMNDEKWMLKFSTIPTNYDPLNEELKDAFESALEFMDE